MGDGERANTMANLYWKEDALQHISINFVQGLSRANCEASVYDGLRTSLVSLLFSQNQTKVPLFSSQIQHTICLLLMEVTKLGSSLVPEAALQGNTDPLFQPHCLFVSQNTTSRRHSVYSHSWEPGILRSWR